MGFSVEVGPKLLDIGIAWLGSLNIEKPPDGGLRNPAFPGDFRLGKS